MSEPTFRERVSLCWLEFGWLAHIAAIVAGCLAFVFFARAYCLGCFCHG